MKILVDSGATKAEWCVLDGTKVRDRFVTPGINWASQSRRLSGKTLQQAAERCLRTAGDPSGVQVHFFGAGLLEGEAPLQAVFPGAGIEAASDLVGAARAVCGHAPGIACILGTGSNTCDYDGEQIVSNVHPCGFILGDEGSAASLGKHFLGAYLKGLVPEEVAKDFSARYPDTGYADVVGEVYRGSAPARYLGSFAPYIVGWWGRNDWMTRLVEKNFQDFIDLFLRQYDLTGKEIGVVGGFGFACKEILQKVGADLPFGRFLAAPMDGLIDYYAYD